MCNAHTPMLVSFKDNNYHHIVVSCLDFHTLVIFEFEFPDWK